MKPEEVTDQILGVWNEVAEPEQPETEEPEPEEGATVEPAEEVVAEPEPDSGEEEGEQEEEGDDEDAEEEPGEEGEQPEQEETAEEFEPDVRAYLDRYQGDVGRALKGAIQLQQALGRQGQEKAVLTRRVSELEGALAETSAFGTGPLLSEEQRNWVGEALATGNPLVYVREAVKAGEYDLARGVCAAWGDHAPYDALRAAQMIDYAESTALNSTVEAEPPQPINHGELLDVLAEHFPELPGYAEQMTTTISQLGENHPLVIDARSNDPEQAVRGVIGIYEIARASTNAVSQTREVVKNGRRDEATAARKKAVVSTSEASPSPSESPRAGKIGPGLTLDQLDEEWGRHT